jgi:hypothetical protein
MNHPGVWMGDLADDDRGHGMGIVVEYAGQKGKPIWTPPKPFHWTYERFATGHNLARVAFTTSRREYAGHPGSSAG